MVLSILNFFQEYPGTRHEMIRAIAKRLGCMLYYGHVDFLVNTLHALPNAILLFFELDKQFTGLAFFVDGLEYYMKIGIGKDRENETKLKLIS